MPLEGVNNLPLSDGNGTFAALGLGIIEWKSDTDRHQNKVTVITLPDNTKYRMVHHVSRGSYEYATIYAGRNKFMRYKYRETRSDCATNTVQLGNFSVSWGDGDPLHEQVEPNLPPQVAAVIKPIIGGLKEDGNEQALFILNVLLHAGNLDCIWQSKEN